MNTKDNFKLSLKATAMQFFAEHRWLALWIIFLCLWRLIMSATLGLGDDEGYYYDWSQNLALGYFDHPPMVSWLIAVALQVLPKAEWAVRAPFILLSVACIALLYLNARRIRNPHFFEISVFAFTLLPLYSFGSWMAFPDLPMMAAWLLALYACHRLVQEPAQWTLWILVSFACGMAVLSKLTGFLLVGSCGLWILANGELRRRILSWPFLVALLLFIVLISPVAIWNWQHDFPTMRFQLVDRHNSGSLSLTRELQFIIVQLVILSPLVGLWVTREWARALLAPKDLRSIWIICFSLFPAGVFALQALKAPFMIHWSAPVFLPLFMMWPGLKSFSWRWRKLNLSYLVTINILYLVVCSYPFMTKVSQLFGKDLPPRADISNDFYGWPEAGEWVKKRIALHAGSNQPIELLAARYQIAGNLSFYSGHQAFAVGERANAYRFFKQPQQNQNSIVIFVSDNRYSILPENMGLFEGCVEIEKLPIYRSAVQAREFIFWECRTAIKAGEASAERALHDRK